MVFCKEDLLRQEREMTVGEEPLTNCQQRSEMGIRKLQLPMSKVGEMPGVLGRKVLLQM